MEQITTLAAVALAIGADVDKAWDIAERVASRLEGREAYQAVIDEIVTAKYAVIG